MTEMNATEMNDRKKKIYIYMMFDPYDIPGVEMNHANPSSSRVRKSTEVW
jgi:hypothetical protein